jgi:hypothetical protein
MEDVRTNPDAFKEIEDLIGAMGMGMNETAPSQPPGTCSLKRIWRA